MCSFVRSVSVYKVTIPCESIALCGVEDEAMHSILTQIWISFTLNSLKS